MLKMKALGSHVGLDQWPPLAGCKAGTITQVF